MALLYQKFGKHSEAFDIWSDLLKNNISDERFPGMEAFIDNMIQ